MTILLYKWYIFVNFVVRNDIQKIVTCVKYDSVGVEK